MKSRVGSISQLLFVDILGSIAYFPLWWYTRGLGNVVGAALHAIRYRSQSYALKIWIRNFFVPMYGQYDWAGRLISVFMRFFVILGRSIALAVESVIYGVGIVIWIIAPPVTILLAIQSGLFRLIGVPASVVPTEITL